MKISYLIAYDITDDLRLSKVSRYLKGRGIHVQYSVFYCHIRPEVLIEIKRNLRDLIDSKKDDIRIYPVTDKFKPIVLGRGSRIPDGAEIFL